MLQINIAPKWLALNNILLSSHQEDCIKAPQKFTEVHLKLEVGSKCLNSLSQNLSQSSL